MKKVISIVALAFLLFGNAEYTQAEEELDADDIARINAIVAGEPLITHVYLVKSGKKASGTMLNKCLNSLGKDEDMSLVVDGNKKIGECLAEGTKIVVKETEKIYGDKIGASGLFQSANENGAEGINYNEKKHELRLNKDGLTSLAKNIKPGYCMMIDIAPRRAEEKGLAMPVRVTVMTTEESEVCLNRKEVKAGKIDEVTKRSRGNLLLKLKTTATELMLHAHHGTEWTVSKQENLDDAKDEGSGEEA